MSDSIPDSVNWKDGIFNLKPTVRCCRADA